MRLIDADIFLSKIEPDEYYHTNEIMDILPVLCVPERFYPH